MTVLLLRLAGPMQSWGTRSRFFQRDTGLEPSRSGVIGLLCAALGRPRHEPLDDFLPLRMAVRVDREGRLMRDFHTAMDVRRADPTKGTQDTVVSERYYLADADFLVGLAGERTFLERLEQALHEPVWPLSLGRKSFVPAMPVGAGLHEGDLLETLRRQPWQRREREHPRDVPGQLRYAVEAAFGQGEPRQDVPLSFASHDRRFAVRHVQTLYFPHLPETPVTPTQEAARAPE